MRRTEHVFQPGNLPQSMTCYSSPGICRSSDSAFLTPQFLHRIGANSVYLRTSTLGIGIRSADTMTLVIDYVPDGPQSPGFSLGIQCMRVTSCRAGARVREVASGDQREVARQGSVVTKAPL
jgi:hypothetical protein